MKTLGSDLVVQISLLVQMVQRLERFYTGKVSGPLVWKGGGLKRLFLFHDCLNQFLLLRLNVCVGRLSERFLFYDNAEGIC